MFVALSSGSISDPADVVEGLGHLELLGSPRHDVDQEACATRRDADSDETQSIRSGRECRFSHDDDVWGSRVVATCVVEVSGPPAVDCVWQKWWSGVDADPRDDGQAHSSSAATIRDTRNVSRTRDTCSRCILVAGMAPVSAQIML